MMHCDLADMAIDDLLAHLRTSRVVARYFEPNGQLVRVAGGDGPDDNGGPDGDDGAGDDKGGGDDSGGTDKGGSDDKDDKGGDDDKGFPANTPVAEMTPAQQAAYWQDKARKHERESKSKGKELDKLRRDNASDEERKILDAKEEGRNEALATVGSRLVEAEIRAASAGRLDDKARTALLEHLDHSKFLDDDGDVDTDKVAALIEGIAGPQSDTGNRTFPDLGQGRRQGGNGKASVASGRDLFEERRKKPSSAAS